MAMTSWREVRREHGLLVLATAGASLILETQRLAGGDAQLTAAIARLAPHLAFGEVGTRGSFVERMATSRDERVVIGCYTRGAWSRAYLVASLSSVEIDDVVAAHLADAASPFDHMAD